jgi:hypothetical protein
VNTATIKITAAERKEGVSKKTGNPYTKYIVHAEGGAQYDTFDAGLYMIANNAVGQHATALYETGQFGNDLKSLAVIEGQSIAVSQDFSAPTESPAAPNDGPDWDLIGLRKTRCALWAAYLGGALAAVVPTSDRAAVGRQLVLAAEADIFHRDNGPGEGPELDIPFARSFG